MLKNWLIAAPLFGALFLTACSNDNGNTVQGYIEGEYIYVGSDDAGVLQKLDVSRGQSIKTGDQLFEIEQQPTSDQLAQAKATLASSTSTLEDMKLGERPDEISEIKAQRDSAAAQAKYYKEEAARYKKLADQDYSSKSDYEQNLAKYQSFEATVAKYDASLKVAEMGDRENQIKAQASTVAADQANLSQAQWTADQTTIAADTNGVINDTYYWPGEWVAAGQPIVSILSPEHVKVIFFVPEEHLSQIQVGDEVTVTCDNCQATTAKISYISDQNEYTPPVIYSNDMREKLVYEVKADFSADIALKFHPGQPISVTFGKAQS